MQQTPTFRKGDHVIYKNNGVCRIEDIRSVAFTPGQAREYYILTPLSENGTVYVPTEGELAQKLKKIPSKEEIDGLIDRAERSDLKWIENSKLRIAAFDRLLSSSDRVSILWLLKVLTAKKQEEALKNKRLCANEDRILTSAEKIITEEFAFALDLPKNEVVPYILEKIGKQKS